MLPTELPEGGKNWGVARKAINLLRKGMARIHLDLMYLRAGKDVPNSRK